MQVYKETTVFMQKAIYYVSRLIAARGVIELTDKSLNFDVSSLDSSFGIKGVSLDLSSILDLRIECGDIHPRVVVITDLGKYEFVLANGQELYDRLRDIQKNPIIAEHACQADDNMLECSCGREVNCIYRYCPWCDLKL